MSFNKEFFTKIFKAGYVSREKMEDYDPMYHYDDKYTCDGCKYYDNNYFPCVGCIRFNHSDKYTKMEEK